MLSTADPASAPVLYAFTLGLVAALSPCGFPLLPAYLTMFVDGDGHEGLVHRTARGLSTGVCATAGFVAVFGVLGGLVEGGVQVLARWVPWVMIVLGVALAAYGVLTLLNRGPRLTPVAIRLGGRRGVLATVGFGVAYAVASLSCALPLFVAGVASTFSRRGPLDGLAAALAYALGMGLFLVGASLAAAWAGGSVLRSLRPLSRWVPYVGGTVLTIVGTYLVYYWATDLLDPSLTPFVVRVVEAIPSTLSGWLAGAARPLGALLGLAVVGSCAFLALRAPSADPDEARGAVPLATKPRQEVSEDEHA